MSRSARALALVALLALHPAAARASAPTTFGAGARSAALALSDVADPDPASASAGNAAAATEPGLRVRLGYGYGAVAMRIDGEDAGVLDASGLDLAAQIGTRAAARVDVGLALSAYIPDRAIARVAFRPATEPQFVRYEASLQRTSFDLVGALRYGILSVGGGIALSLDVGGEGTRFDLGQDARGTYADADADIELPYRVAPIAGMRLSLGRFTAGAAFRGPLAVDLTLLAENRIELTDSPLNGTTAVRVQGAAGYDPATLAVGGAVDLAWGLSAHAALEYAFWSFAPAPVAEVELDVGLGTTPSQRQARFVLPRFRDTIAPRVGLELRRPARHGSSGQRGAVAGEQVRPKHDALAERGRGDAWRWAARAGYLVSPSPVPPQTGFTSYADATRHAVAFGGAYRFGRALGVELSAAAAGQLHLLAPRSEQKASDALPHARYETGGRILYGTLSLEGVWR